MISSCLCNGYLHRLDRQWNERGTGVLVRFADDLLVLCHTRREAEAALEALRSILAELGLPLKPAKTRIVHLREGGEGIDFLGFHHRRVRGERGYEHQRFLARWPSREAMQRSNAGSPTFGSGRKQSRDVWSRLAAAWMNRHADCSSRGNPEVSSPSSSSVPQIVQSSQGLARRRLPLAFR